MRHVTASVGFKDNHTTKRPGRKSSLVNGVVQGMGGVESVAGNDTVSASNELNNCSPRVQAPLPCRNPCWKPMTAKEGMLMSQDEYESARGCGSRRLSTNVWEDRPARNQVRFQPLTETSGETSGK